MTLDQITSAIRTHIGNGLKEVTNFTYSVEQIKKEIGLMRAEIILNDSKKGILKPNHFVQKFDNRDLSLKKFPHNSVTNSLKKVWYTQIPRLAMTNDDSPITYAGPTDLSDNFKVYYDDSYRSHQYKRVTSRSPFIYADLSHDYTNHTDLYFFNIDGSGLRKVSIRGIIADPISVLESDGIFGEDEEFPAPQAVQNVIIKSLTSRYIDFYKRLNHKSESNTQTDKN